MLLKMKSCLIFLGCLYLLHLPYSSHSILLCDGDCRNNSLEICQETPKDKTLLNVMALFPCNVPGFRARGLTVAAQMAVQKISNETNLLNGYRLKLRVENTMVCTPMKKELCHYVIFVLHNYNCDPYIIV